MREAIQVCAGCSSNGLLHKNLALTQCQAGQFEDCESELRAALELLPGDAEILKALEVLANLRAKSR